jgi:uncharacterized membrane protein (DUF2068 family)
MESNQHMLPSRNIDGTRCAGRPARRLSGMSSFTVTNAKATLRKTHRAGLRTVAFFEALKGVLALVLAYVVTRAIRHDFDFEDAAEHILGFFHIGLHHSLSKQFLDAADKLSGAHIATIIGLALAYATLRFLEAYGLWRARAWAEWLAIISGCIYIPFEVERLIRRPTPVHWIILTTNILIVLYIAWVRWDEIKAARRVRLDV